MSGSLQTREGKHLRYSEEHFQGYWVQLNAIIRRNEDADMLVDGLLENPIEELWHVLDKKDRTDPLWDIAPCIRSLYEIYECGDPPGTFPPTLEQMDLDPLKFIKDFAKATARGTRGGKNAEGRTSPGAKKWAKTTYRELVIYRRACKYVWEVIVATLSTAEATTVIAGLPYG